MDLEGALSFARHRHDGVLVTLRRDGRPQLSNIAFGVGADGIIRVSITDSRAKAKNLRRDPKASLYVPGDSFWSYVVLDGTAELSPVASATDDETVEELIALFRTIRGEEHPDWEDYRQAMVDDRRLVVRLRPTHGYGMVNG
jgi:PPOX class probable F420-dependent enzyme